MRYFDSLSSLLICACPALVCLPVSAALALIVGAVSTALAIVILHERNGE